MERMHREHTYFPSVSCKKNCFRGLSSWSSDYLKVKVLFREGGVGDQ